MKLSKDLIYRLKAEHSIGPNVSVERGALVEYVGDTKVGMVRVRVLGMSLILRVPAGQLEVRN